MSTGGGTGSPILGVAGGVGSVLPIAVSGSSRGELRAELARMFGFVEGVASAGATDGITDTSLFRWPDDYFVGANVWISEADGAAPEGEQSWVSDFVNSTGVLSLRPALTAAVAAGDHYHVFMVVGKDDIDRAIQRACRGGEAICTLTADEDTLDYDLTYITGLSDARQVRAVWRRAGNDDEIQPYRMAGWQIADNFGQLTLQLAAAPSADDGLWIEYELDERGMEDDAQRCNLPLDLILARAKVYLLQNLLAKQDTAGMDKYGQLLRFWQDEQVKEERRWQPKSGTAPSFVVMHLGRGRDCYMQRVFGLR